ncbi:MAG: SUMF1/EgtB/PvdO family nonheme iron enzyme [Cellvibrionaceae bacterium]
MDQQKALTLLGLEQGANSEQINQAYSAKKKKVDGLLEKAPSDALKEKYHTMLKPLEQAQQELLGGVAAGSHVGSSLSQSKFDDLPNAQARHSQFEEQAKTQLNLKPGDVLANRYEIKEQIGAGGMGAVFQATDRTRQQDIAIKVMLPSLVNNERAKSRFMDEARLSSQLSHPNIVNVFDVQQEGEFVFLTMELLHGQDLRSLMETRKLSRQAFSEEEAKNIVFALTEALGHAHKQTVHRDIKPENVWVDEEGDVKLMDFGIARVMSNSQRTQSGVVSGTAYYMAPEQLKGTSKVDGRADIYALGVMLYELLSGDVPAGRIKPIRELRPDLSKGFAHAIDQSLEPNPDDRYSDIHDFTEALQKKKGGAGLNLNINRGALAMAAMLIVGLLLMGGIWQSGLIDTDKLFISKEEIAQKKAVSAKLAGEIKTLQKRLDTGKRTLDSDVRDAQRNSSADLAALEYWQRTTEDAIFEGSTLVELEGQLAMAQTLLRDESFEQAQQHFTTVKTGYKTLYNNFQAGEQLHALQQNAEAEYNAWAKLKRNYGVSNLSAERKAQDLENQAKQQERTGELAQATHSWKDTIEAWQAAQNSVGDEVAAIADRRAKDKARKAALLKRITPQMVSIPGGSFMMGSNEYSDEKPVHRVQISPFKMGKYEITWAQYQPCIDEGACLNNDGDGGDKGWGKGNRPMINVSWNDITQHYIPWLNRKTGKRFRLPTEAEWEYAARAGSTSKYSWGNSIDCSKARYGYYSDECGKQKSTDPVGSFAPNTFGLYDMHGNVWEWVQDCWNDNYSGAPSNGSAWESGDCAKRVLRGGSWFYFPHDLRSAFRNLGSAGNRDYSVGFRLVQDN